MVGEIKKYKYIDALRGLAILGVVLVHTSQSFTPSNSILLFITSLGSSGVQLFFIASALTLCYSWNSRKHNEINVVSNFFIRRILRIVPLFWTAIVFYTLLFGMERTYFAPNGINWWSITSTVLFLHGLHPETLSAVVPGGWSIAAEMTFYLFFPVLISKLEDVKSKIYFLLFSLLIFPLMQSTVINLFQGYSPELIHDFVLLNFLGQLPVFAVGLLTYELIAEDIKQHKKWKYYIGILMLISLLIFVIYPYKPRIISLSFVFSIGFCMLAYLLSKRPMILLVNQITTTLGKFSFSMYISHFAIIHFIRISQVSERIGIRDFNLKFLFLFVLITLLTFLLSKILYYIIEKPGIDLGKWLLKRYSR